jgi:hypothetical protein
MAVGMSWLEKLRFERESELARTEPWTMNAARWPCPWIWHEIDGPWGLGDRRQPTVELRFPGIT